RLLCSKPATIAALWRSGAPGRPPRTFGRSASGGRHEPSFLSREERRSRGEEGRRRRCGDEAGSKTASWGRSAHKGPLVAAATPRSRRTSPPDQAIPATIGIAISAP